MFKVFNGLTPTYNRLLTSFRIILLAIFTSKHQDFTIRKCDVFMDVNV